MKHIEQIIIDNVRRKRLELNFTVQEISSILEISQNFINNVESKNAHHKYNFIHLAKLAFLFDCNIEDFFPPKKDYFPSEEIEDLTVIKQQIVSIKNRRILKRR